MTASGNRRRRGRVSPPSYDPLSAMLWTAEALQNSDRIYPSLVLGFLILSLSKKLCTPFLLRRRHLLVTFFFIVLCALAYCRHSSLFLVHMLSPCLGCSVSVFVDCVHFKYSMVLNLLCAALGSVRFPLQFIDTLECCRGWLSVIERWLGPCQPVPFMLASRAV